MFDQTQMLNTTTVSNEILNTVTVTIQMQT